MFDGVDQVTVVTADTRAPLALYRDQLGFREVARADLDDPCYAELLELDGAGPLSAVLLGKPGSAGGWIRLVQAPGLPPVAERRTMHRPGPFALDFYVRDLPERYAELVAAGHRFRSPPRSYELAGAGFAVDEVLLEAPEGFVHALVEYLPGRHRCVLGTAPDQTVSEVVAAVTVLDDVEEGLPLLRDVLGGQVYYDQRFGGADVTELIGLPGGSTFRVVMLRGPASRNARVELMERVDAPGQPTGQQTGHPRLLLGCRVPDLPALVRRLGADPRNGALHGPFTVANPIHGHATVASLRTPWGAFFEFWQEDPR